MLTSLNKPLSIKNYKLYNFLKTKRINKKKPASMIKRQPKTKGTNNNCGEVSHISNELRSANYNQFKTSLIRRAPCEMLVGVWRHNLQFCPHAALSRWRRRSNAAFHRDVFFFFWTSQWHSRESFHFFSSLFSRFWCRKLLWKLTDFGWHAKKKA